MSTDQTLRTALMSSSKFDACQGLRVDDAWDRSDLVDDDLTEDIEILGLDFRDQVVLSDAGRTHETSPRRIPPDTRPPHPSRRPRCEGEPSGSEFDHRVSRRHFLAIRAWPRRLPLPPGALRWT